MGLLIPAVVAENEELAKRLDAVSAARERGSFLQHFDSQLKELDPRLSLVKASENADLPGLIPGFWHVARDNEQTMNSYLPITGSDGEFSEPHSGVLRDLQQADLQRPNALAELREHSLKKRQHNERLRQAFFDAQKQEFAERYKSLTSKSVLFK